MTETERLSYQQAFLRYANIDPLTASTEDIICRCRQQPATMSLGDDRDSWLNFLLADYDTNLQASVLASVIASLKA